MPIQNIPTLVLIPLLDSMNHENVNKDADSKLFQRFHIQSNMLVIQCGKNFTNNEEATISYGGGNNLEFFSGYGFIPYENRIADEYKLQINDLSKYIYMIDELVKYYPQIHNYNNRKEYSKTFVYPLTTNLNVKLETKRREKD